MIRETYSCADTESAIKTLTEFEIDETTRETLWQVH